MPLLWISAAFVTGIVIDNLVHLGWWVWVCVGSVSLLITVASSRMGWKLPPVGRVVKSPLPMGVLLCALALGGTRGTVAALEWSAGDVAFYNDQGMAQMVGVVARPPDRRETSTMLTVKVSEYTPLVESPQSATMMVEGMTLVMKRAGGSWQYGDVVVIRREPQTPGEDEDFSYREYLAQRGIHTVIYFPSVRTTSSGKGNPILRGIYELRERAHQVIRQMYSPPEDALLSGILLGIESGFPDNLWDDFKDTGTSHIIVISGFNIAILAGFFSWIFKQVIPGRWVSFLLTLGAISAYTMLVGGDPPVVRAAVMGAMGLLGRLIGRQQAGANSLCFTAAVMCLFNPLLPWNVSFQLSFMATLGLILFADPLQEGFVKLASRFIPTNLIQRIANPVSEFILLTVAAQLTTLPIIAYHFGRISLSSFVANILILPAQPLVMALGGASLLAGLLVLPLGQLLAYAGWGPLAYTIRIVEVVAQTWSGVVALGDVSLWLVAVYYAILGLLWNFKERISSLRVQAGAAAGLLALGLAAAAVTNAALPYPDGRLTLTVLNVEDGPAYLVKTPGERAVLVNGSSSASQLGSALARHLPTRIRDLDFLILTTSATKPLQGLPETLERFPARQALVGNNTSTSTAAWRHLDETLKEQAIILPAETGQAIDLGQGAALHVLADTPKGTALLVEWGGFTTLIPGGVGAYTLERLLEGQTYEISTLILAKEDLETDTLDDWQELEPTLVLWHTEEPLQWTAEGENWASIDEHEWVKISTDGEQMWVEVE